MTIDWLLQLELVARLLIAAALGAAIGAERQQAEKPARLRDYLLVALGAATFTLVSTYGFPGGDTGRVAAQVVSGIGFLGAGVIIRQEGTVIGVTTAAGIWVSAAIGMAVGAGLYVVAVAATVVSVIALRLRALSAG